MLNEISINGYKCIDSLNLYLQDFTLLAGVNSAGKSSVLQTILFLMGICQPADRHMIDLRYANLGKFTDIRNNVIGNREIRLSISASLLSGETFSIKSIVENAATTPSANPIKTVEKYYDNYKMIFLPVERIGVENSYEVNIQNADDIGVRGEYVYAYLAQHGQDRLVEEKFLLEEDKNVGMSLSNQVDYWLEYLLGFRMKANLIQDVDQVVVTYANAQSHHYYRAKNVGTGVTYISTLIIAALACKLGDTLIIENPEIHLHPRAQSRFMEFLAFLSERGLQIILETHSDHIYNGMRKCIKNKSLSREKIAAYYFELNQSMQTHVEEIHFNDEGAELNHPYGMFDQFDDDLDELLGL